MAEIAHGGDCLWENLLLLTSPAGSVSSYHPLIFAKTHYLKYNLVMQDIVNQTRALLKDHIGGDTATDYFLPSYTPAVFRMAYEPTRLKYRIPRKNYEDLDKFVPISWI